MDGRSGEIPVISDPPVPGSGPPDPVSIEVYWPASDLHYHIILCFFIVSSPPGGV